MFFLFTMYRSINYTSLYLLPELVATRCQPWLPGWAPLARGRRRTGAQVKLRKWELLKVKRVSDF